MLEIEVCEIRGKCPVYKVGDKIIVDGPNVVLEETDAVCVACMFLFSDYIIPLKSLVKEAR